MNETYTLVEACWSIAGEPLPDDVEKYARLLLLDYLGVAAAGAELEESSRHTREVAAAMGGAAESTAFGLEEKLPAPAAAFVNGVTAHGVEMDDTHSPASSHPGVVVWSAGLAVAEQEGRSGEALLPAVAAGYELACRVGYAASPSSMYARGFHPTSASGVFGAALTSACLMELDLEAARMAVGIAGSFAAGNMEYLAQGSMTKRLQPGQAAHAGILSALLARQGFTGPETILEGEFGFLHAYSDGADPHLLTESLGETWEIQKTGLKAYGCCRYMHSPIEASLRAIEGQPWSVDEVVGIRVGLVDAGWGLVVDPIAHKYTPATRVDGQFSLPFGVATALVHGQATVHEFRETQLADPTILSLARKVTVERDGALDRVYPTLWPSWSEIELTDGRVLRGEVNTTKGDPDNPLKPEEVRAKFEALAWPYWSEREAHEVVSLVNQVQARDTAELMARVRCRASGARSEKKRPMTVPDTSVS